MTLNQLQRKFSTGCRYLWLSFKWIIKLRQKRERDIVVGEWMNILVDKTVAKLKVLV
jgi:hypothetical protein